MRADVSVQVFGVGRRNRGIHAVQQALLEWNDIAVFMNGRAGEVGVRNGQHQVSLTGEVFHHVFDFLRGGEQPRLSADR